MGDKSPKNREKKKKSNIKKKGIKPVLPVTPSAVTPTKK